MTLWDVHTLAGDGPVRHYQQYPDERLAERMRTHLAPIVHRELVVEAVEVPDPAPEVTG